MLLLQQKPHTVVPISATGLPSDAGLWTGTDGSCTWKYDVISRTLRISGAQKSSQLSSTPFLKQFKWSGNIEHIVFETPSSNGFEFGRKVCRS
ncbi:hypothetical protein SDC49_06950 [Lactobacillus sp. R2/2]|nr:hypothetical protein [Lactobacillus sp. R2/2]